MRTKHRCGEKLLPMVATPQKLVITCKNFPDPVLYSPNTFGVLMMVKFAIVITCKPFPAIRYVHVVSTLGTYTHVYTVTSRLVSTLEGTREYFPVEVTGVRLLSTSSLFLLPLSARSLILSWLALLWFFG